jgi:hypothetical protein
VSEPKKPKRQRERNGWIILFVDSDDFHRFPFSKKRQAIEQMDEYRKQGKRVFLKREGEPRNTIDDGWQP